MNTLKKSSQKKILVTGFTPTGCLTLGNYLGVIKKIEQLQSEYKLIIFCANYHVLNSIMINDTNKIQQSQHIIENTFKTLALLLAAGINYEENAIFIQSQIKEIIELSYILTCKTPLGKLFRMTQFKTKRQLVYKKSISTGLLIYPCLMAADILAYQSDVVLIGYDQKQHIELCKEIVNSWKSDYKKNTFKIPKIKINTLTCKIMSLTDPTKKMSKSSENANSHILLLDDPMISYKKIIKAVTDSENKIYYDVKNKPGISNLLTIYASLTNKNIDEAQLLFKNVDYKSFKEKVGNIVKDFLIDYQAKFKKNYNKDFLLKISKQSIEKIRPIAKQTLLNAKKCIGII